MGKILISLIKFYQRTLSPDHSWLRVRYPHGYCRYHPSCSQYAIDAIHHHGALRGGWRSLGRIARCNPWSKGGIDPAI